MKRGSWVLGIEWKKAGIGMPEGGGAGVARALTLIWHLFVTRHLLRAASLEDAARRINSVAVKHLAGYQWVNKRYKI